MEKFQKYEIVSGWNHPSGHYVEGSNKYNTIEELIAAFKNKENPQNIKRICITCEYSNSLTYTVREAVLKDDYKELQKELLKAGISDQFVDMMAGTSSM